MPGVTLPPDYARGLGGPSGPIARVERIERRTLDVGIPDPIVQHFTYPGALSANIVSPPWYVPKTGHIEFVRVSLTSTATGTNTISLRVNGVEKQQFTISSGVTASFATSISVQYSQYVTIATVAVADSNMAVELRLR